MAVWNSKNKDQFILHRAVDRMCSVPEFRERERFNLFLMKQFTLFSLVTSSRASRFVSRHGFSLHQEFTSIRLELHWCNSLPQPLLSYPLTLPPYLLPSPLSLTSYHYLLPSPLTPNSYPHHLLSSPPNLINCLA